MMRDETKIETGLPGLPSRAVSDKDRLLGESKVFCMAPWAQMSIKNGTAKLCCKAREGYWDATKTPLEQIWNSPQLMELRRNMLQGKESPLCGECYEMESRGWRGVRQQMNRDYARYFPAVEATHEDGTAQSYPVYLELALSDLCNFKCRICGPWSSTAWQAEAGRLHLKYELSFHAGRVLTLGGEPSRFDWRSALGPWLPHLRHIRFIGGEPLLDPRHCEILEFLIQSRMVHVEIAYHTNFSVTAIPWHDVLKLWNEFESVTVSASLDGMGPRGEYLRKGQHWEQTVANRERMLQVCPRAHFTIGSTLNVMNALHLPDFHWEWLRKGYVDPEELYINMLSWPEHYSIQILPMPLKRAVVEKYRAHMERLSDGYGSRAAPSVRRYGNALEFLMTRDESARLAKFRMQTALLDMLRGEKFEAVFPEMAALMEGPLAARPAAGFSASPA